MSGNHEKWHTFMNHSRWEQAGKKANEIREIAASDKNASPFSVIFYYTINNRILIKKVKLCSSLSSTYLYLCTRLCAFVRRRTIFFTLSPVCSKSKIITAITATTVHGSNIITINIHISIKACNVFAQFFFRPLLSSAPNADLHSKYLFQFQRMCACVCEKKREKQTTRNKNTTDLF